MGNFINQSYNRISSAISGEKPAKAKAPIGQIHNTGNKPLAHMDIGSKWSYSTLEYPADIQQRSDLGHYMMFYVNVIDSYRSGYSTFNSYQKVSNQTDNEQSDSDHPVVSLSPDQRALRDEQKYATGAGSNEFGDTSGDEFTWAGGGTWKPGSKPKVVGRVHYQGRLSKQIEGSKKRTVRTTDSIVLYMPSTIQTNTNAIYKSTEMGNLASTLGGAASQIYARGQEIGYFNACLLYTSDAADE